jgi:hypothetical protein
MSYTLSLGSFDREAAARTPIADRHQCFPADLPWLFPSAMALPGWQCGRSDHALGGLTSCGNLSELYVLPSSVGFRFSWLVLNQQRLGGGTAIEAAATTRRGSTATPTIDRPTSTDRIIGHASLTGGSIGRVVGLGVAGMGEAGAGGGGRDLPCRQPCRIFETVPALRQMPPSCSRPSFQQAESCWAIAEDDRARAGQNQNSLFSAREWPAREMGQQGGRRLWQPAQAVGACRECVSA